MRLKRVAEVTVMYRDQPMGAYWVYEQPDGRHTEELVCQKTPPDYGLAAILLSAAASALQNSAGGQVVQAAISLCSVNLQREVNEKGNLSTFEDELPF